MSYVFSCSEVIQKHQNMKVAVVLLSAFAACVSGAAVRQGDFCPMFCPMIYEPVCGSDMKTYDNHCLFHRAQCMDSTLTFLSQGPCHEISVREIICTTPWCWPNHAPVCGNDGVTYENQCELNNAMCSNEYLKIQHLGPCGQ